MQPTLLRFILPTLALTFSACFFLVAIVSAFFGFGGVAETATDGGKMMTLAFLAATFTGLMSQWLDRRSSRYQHHRRDNVTPPEAQP
jgi:uncharacterized membrane protein YtjA (UPF0391 family)